MLSKTADNALRALLLLAGREDARPVPVDHIAEALGAPRNYLGKTLHVLAGSGLLEGVRGPTGGYRLGRAADRITVSDVVEALDDVAERRSMCLLGDRPCDETEPCAAHHAWSAVAEAARTPLRTTTLADLIGDASSNPR